MLIRPLWWHGDNDNTLVPSQHFPAPKTVTKLMQSIRGLVPSVVKEQYRQLLRSAGAVKNKRKSAEQVFTEVYTRGSWGGQGKTFDSGSGTGEDRVVAPYISTISALAQSRGFKGRSFVDLGCGDFRVGSRLLPLCSAYVGVDVVKPLVDYNQAHHGNDIVRFQHLDIIEDELPVGEVCFVRQVLQHLSNDQIAKILPKLSRYRWVFITEHYPRPNDRIKPNLDKVHGHDVRAYRNSGVYLSLPPFSLAENCLEEVLEVKGTDLGKSDPGVIKTFLYTPPGSRSK
jgi:SAM-dependent methyltransferase